MMILGILKAVLKKDFQTLIKYKLNLFTTLFSILFYILIIFFFSETFTIKDPISEGNDQNSLFLFFLSGLLLIDLTVTCASNMPLTINFYQTSGIMEELISDFKTLLFSVIFSISLPFLISLIKFFVYLLLAKFLLSQDIIFSLQLLILFPYFFIYLLSIAGIGLIASSLTIVFKRGNPIIQLNNILTLSLSGAFIPISQLGWIVDSLSHLLPAKHYLEILRRILGIYDSNLALITSSTIWLSSLSLIFFLLGTFVFKQAINYAKLNNNISDY